MNTEKPAKTAKQALIAVEWILQNVGWCKNHYQNFNDEGKPTAACLAGALELIVADSSIRIEAESILEEQVSIDHGNFSLVSFNDKSETSKKDVLKLVKNAIKRA